MAWTEERVDLLKTLWAEGLSGSQICNRLGGGVSRSAVIGKIHRLKLSGRAARSPSQKWAAANARRNYRRKLKETFAPLPPRLPRLPRAPMPLPQETDIARVSFLEMDEIAVAIPLADGGTRIVVKHCKFPVLEDVAPPHVKQYCGDERLPGTSYCQHHHARAFAKLERRPPTTPSHEWIREKGGGYTDHQRSKTLMKVGS